MVIDLQEIANQRRRRFRDFATFMLMLLAAMLLMAFLTGGAGGCTEQQKADAQQIELQAAHSAVDIAASAGAQAAHQWIDQQAKPKPATQP